MTTATTYRVDYADPDPAPGWDRPIVINCGTDRRRAMRLARDLSDRPEIGTAYAIATRDGRDTGQRVYAYGHFSHTDDRF